MDIDLLLSKSAVVVEVFRKAVHSKSDFGEVLAAQDFVLVARNRIRHTYMNGNDMEFAFLQNGGSNMMLLNLYSTRLSEEDEDLKHFIEKYTPSFSEIHNMVSGLIDDKCEIKSHSYDEDGAPCETLSALWRMDGRNLSIVLSVGGLENSISITAYINSR